MEGGLLVRITYIVHKPPLIDSTLRNSCYSAFVHILEYDADLRCFGMIHMLGDF